MSIICGGLAQAPYTAAIWW